MPRRRLRLHHYSSEEEEEDQQQQQQEAASNSTETLISPNPNPEPRPLSISDEDFLDVAEDLSPPSPPASIPVPGPSSTQSPNFPIHQYLENLGLRLKREWLDSCTSRLNTSISGFPSLDVPGKSHLCFAQFLFSDMNVIGGGVLPPNVHDMHLVQLPGPFVLQVDEIVNISCPLKDRYQKASAGIKRCLKLSMTDGVQRVFGMEYRPIKDIEALAPAGFKVCISNVHIRRGLLLLVPEALDILGGRVESLDAARQRLVNEVNKPPRGKRTRTGFAPSLSSRAARAAWPPNNVDDNQNIIDRGNNVNDNGPASTSTLQHRGPDRGNNINNGPASTPTSQHRGPDPGISVNGNFPARTSTSQHRGPDHGNNVIQNGFPSTSTSQHTGPGGMSDQGAAVNTSGVDSRRRITEDYIVRNDRLHTAFSPPISAVPDHRETDRVDASMPNNRNTRGRVAEAFADPRVGSSSEPYPSSNAGLGVRYATSTGRVDASSGISGVDTRGRDKNGLSVHAVSSNVESIQSSNAVGNLQKINIRDARMSSYGNSRGGDEESLASPSFRPNSKPNLHWNSAMDVGEIDSRGKVDAMFVSSGGGMREGVSEDHSVPNRRSNFKPYLSSDAAMNLEEVNMNDVNISNHENSRARLAESIVSPSSAPSWTRHSDFRDTDTRRVETSFATSGADIVGRISQNLFDPNVAPHSPSNAVVDIEESDMIDASMPIHGDDRRKAANTFADTSVRPGAEPIPSSEAAMDIRDTDMDGEVEDPLILNGDNEAPFTYLASLLAKWTANGDEGTPRVVGKTKCFLTGVKEFQFKGRSTYGLRVFVDDGSLISEILIHHDVVQKAIGHSPKEVTAALSSPDSKVATAMREIMKRFQLFLINFEGIMVVETSNRSPFPTAIEMKQGCSSSDSWLLLRRMKRLTSPQTPQRQKPETIVPIDISP